MANWLTVKASRVDTDDVVEVSSLVSLPSSSFGQRLQLTESVRDLYPAAEFRSFHDGVASFLDRKLLIVASYQTRPTGDRTLLGTSAPERLF